MLAGSQLPCSAIGLVGRRDRLDPNETSTYCPFKGEASYYSVITDAGDIVDDVMWTYRNPYPGGSGDRGACRAIRTKPKSASSGVAQATGYTRQRLGVAVRAAWIIPSRSEDDERCHIGPGRRSRRNAPTTTVSPVGAATVDALTRRPALRRRLLAETSSVQFRTGDDAPAGEVVVEQREAFVEISARRGFAGTSRPVRLGGVVGVITSPSCLGSTACGQLIGRRSGGHLRGAAGFAHLGAVASRSAGSMLRVPGDGTIWRDQLAATGSPRGSAVLARRRPLRGVGQRCRGVCRHGARHIGRRRRQRFRAAASGRGLRTAGCRPSA